jgi:hypothetical protein
MTDISSVRKYQTLQLTLMKFLGAKDGSRVSVVFNNSAAALVAVNEYPEYDQKIDYFEDVQAKQVRLDWLSSYAQYTYTANFQKKYVAGHAIMAGLLSKVLGVRLPVSQTGLTNYPIQFEGKELTATLAYQHESFLLPTELAFQPICPQSEKLAYLVNNDLNALNQSIKPQDLLDNQIFRYRKSLTR